MKNPGGIDEESLALFLKATSGTIPIPVSNRVNHPQVPPPPLPVQSLLDEHYALTESIDAPISVDHALDGGDEPVFLRHGIPRSVLRKLRRAHWVAQDALDLHGLNREQARVALAEFLKRNHRLGHRCVRVIHGKGLGSPGKEAVLKAKVKTWLAFRDDVLAYCQAPARLGGSGALLVLLKG